MHEEQVHSSDFESRMARVYNIFHQNVHRLLLYRGYISDIYLCLFWIKSSWALSLLMEKMRCSHGELAARISIPGSL